MPELLALELDTAELPASAGERRGVLPIDSDPWVRWSWSMEDPTETFEHCERLVARWERMGAVLERLSAATPSHQHSEVSQHATADAKAVEAVIEDLLEETKSRLTLLRRCRIESASLLSVDLDARGTRPGTHRLTSGTPAVDEERSDQ